MPDILVLENCTISMNQIVNAALDELHKMIEKNGLKEQKAQIQSLRTKGKKQVRIASISKMVHSLSLNTLNYHCIIKCIYCQNLEIEYKFLPRSLFHTFNLKILKVHAQLPIFYFFDILPKNNHLSNPTLC